jgi:hypothetical protein
MTTKELITAALQTIGELSPGQQPNDEEAASGLRLLNTILENWEVQHRKVFIIDNLRFPLISGKSTYTMGPGGEFDSYRPVKIQSANFLYSDDTNPDHGVAHSIELTNSVQWAQIREKSVAGQRPLKLYNDNDFPLLRLRLWPVPTAAADL